VTTRIIYLVIDLAGVALFLLAALLLLV